MKIIIHRGQHQVGGSIIEIATKATKVIFDVGMNLEEKQEIVVPQIDGLFLGKRQYDAVFLSHYHSDHIGLSKYILGEIPIYMGETAYQIMCASSQYRNIVVGMNPVFIQDRKRIVIGDIQITPVLCDHSAYDSYMFLVEAEGESILYTGDFRANGRQDFSKLLSHIPKVKAVIIEGTTLSRNDDTENLKETYLEEIAGKALKKYSGPAFVMMSAMNIDRLTTIYNVARKNNRILLEDLYTANLARAAGNHILSPMNASGVRVFMTDNNSQRHDELKGYGNKKISRSAIAKTSYIMCIRQSMSRYLTKLNELQSFENGILFYGMWKGYQEKEEMRAFLNQMERRGVKIHTLHTSGHADAKTINLLINHIDPDIIIPVHTENEEWYQRYSNRKVIYNTKVIDLGTCNVNA